MKVIRVKGAKGINFNLQRKRISEEQSAVVKENAMVRRMIRDGDLVVVVKTAPSKKKKGGE